MVRGCAPAKERLWDNNMEGAGFRAHGYCPNREPNGKYLKAKWKLGLHRDRISTRTLHGPSISYLGNFEASV